ncbi:MAG: hypothetical protein ACYS0I_22300 [Planctomycetota bacterium]
MSAQLKLIFRPLLSISAASSIIFLGKTTKYATTGFSFGYGNFGYQSFGQGLTSMAAEGSIVFSLMKMQRLGVASDGGTSFAADLSIIYTFGYGSFGYQPFGKKV